MGGYYPFAAPAYRRGDDNVSRLLLEQGRIAADRAQRSGDIWGNAVQNLGAQAAGALQQHAERKEQSVRSKAFEAAVASGDPQQIIRVLGPRDGPAVINALRAMQPDVMKQYRDRMELFRDVARGVLGVPAEDRPAAYEFARNNLLQGGAAKPEELPEAYEEGIVRQAAAYGSEPAKQEAGFTLGPGQQRFGPDGQPIATVAPTPEKPKRHAVTVPGPNGRPVVRLVTEEELAQGVEAYRAPTQGPAAEPLMAIVGADGQPVYVPRSQAIGKRPASNREQGRPVTSGDAGRVADLDTSLDDLATLAGTLTGSKATGTAAKAGAMLPNFVTEATGIGAEAKSKQAVIDRVKQVIGKALEGGVLRKEDEYKYEKILPTIGDVPSVVKTKLAGLEKAIKQRRETFLASLADAGYDTGKYEARSGAAAADPLGLR